MKKIYSIVLVLLFICSHAAEAQFYKYVIRFKDKTGTPFTISNPSQFLSARAIARRTRQHIAIDELDLPITPRYLDSVRLVGNVTILNKSKWLNQVCILTTDPAALARINNFSFVLAEQPVQRPQTPSAPINKFNEPIGQTTLPLVAQNSLDYFNYGTSSPQIHIHEGEFLHNLGYTGEGMMMAILDDGFKNYQTITAFDSVRNNNRIVETYDYVANDANVNDDDTHGMYCFSIIAANWPGQLVGSCPRANFCLYRTEDVFTESPVEEQNWVAAAERADSNGVDVISTSLGYTTFDNSFFNHTYADMNGKTTIAARGCALTAKKGMISVVAAGNDGTGGWHFIGTPADADSIVTIGAVNSSGIVANFSSYGPSSDGRVKPTVASVGVGTAIAGLNNVPTSGNGTSFATPNMAGLITCLWQAFQDFTNLEIIEAVKRSSSIYSTPDTRIGYGIPNFHKAYDDLTQQRFVRRMATILAGDWMKVYPNPFYTTFTVLINPQRTANANFTLYDAAGKLYLSKTIALQQGITQFLKFDNVQPMARGIYTLKFNDGSTKRSVKLVVE